MTKKTRNWLILFLSIPGAVILAVVGLLIFDAARSLPPIQPLPNPNGYDDLVKAGKMTSTNSWNFDKMNKEQLRETVSENAEALSLARAAFSNQCRVPLQFSKGYLANHIQDVIAIRRLAQALTTEGKLAEAENRFNDAAQSYLAVIHLGNAAGQGGILIDAMIGIAVESLGLDQLQKIADNLNAKSCRDTIQTLETLEIQKQSWVDTMQRQNVWTHQTFGLRGQLLKLIYHSRQERNYQRAIDTIKSAQKKEGQLLMALAARAYELEKGHRPASLVDLVPDYLKAIPQDPFTGKNMVYLP